MSSDKPLRDSPIDFANVGIDMEDVFDTAEGLALEKETTGEKPAGDSRFIISPKPPQERRNWKRFAIEGAVVMIGKAPLLSFLRPTYIMLGPVKDIGMKGLAVHYVEKNGESIYRKAPFLSIMLPGERIVVDKVPFKVVNTFKVADLPGDKEVWSLCVQFEKLLPQQRVQLEAFIDEFGAEMKSPWSKKEK
ncbi:MAG: hypothetical protein AB1724_10675 [Thermodesulfobacteriota bacterium]